MAAWTFGSAVRLSQAWFPIAVTLLLVTGYGGWLPKVGGGARRSRLADPAFASYLWLVDVFSPAIRSAGFP